MSGQVPTSTPIASPTTSQQMLPRPSALARGALTLALTLVLTVLSTVAVARTQAVAAEPDQAAVRATVLAEESGGRWRVRPLGGASPHLVLPG